MKIKFILDAMLGKLARWLRMLGQDTVYSNTFNDVELISKAQKENRILITRDFELYQKSIKNKTKVLFIKVQNIELMLSTLSRKFEFPLVIDMELSHCPKCNIKLQRIHKKEAAKKIEPKTLIHYDKFWVCSQCNSIYWQGSHWNKINLILQKARSC